MKPFIASDGHQFMAYQSEPEISPRGLVIIIQEIFGVTEHLCEIADKLAKEGYLAVVPAFFDRIDPDIKLSYEDAETGRKLSMQLNSDQVLLDIAAVIEAHRNHNVAVMGFCWGGTLAYLAASQLKVKAGVAYYGTRIHQHLDQKPNCPFLFHFGAKDHLVSAADIEQIRQVNMQSPVYIYADAGHAFSCEPRASYHAGSATLSWSRTLEFLGEHLA